MGENGGCRNSFYIIKAAEGGSRVAMGYLLVGHRELKAHHKREFLSMRHGNSSFLGEVRFLV